VKLGRPKIDSATERKVRQQLAKGVGILKVARALGMGLARSIASQTSLAESQHCHFAFVAELFMCGPPVGRTFWFQIFIQAPSPEIWSETISGGEEVLAEKWGGLFLGYLLGKIFRRRDRSVTSILPTAHRCFIGKPRKP
jgi:hypothetical protein